MARDEGAGGGSPVDRLQDRGLYLQEALGVEEAADLGDDPRTQDEDLAHLRVHGEVGVPLAVARLHIRKRRMDHPLARLADLRLPEGERPQALREEAHRLHPDRRLPRLRAEERPLDADPIAQIEQGEPGVGLCAERALAEVQLEAARPVGDLGEGRLPVRPPGDDPARDADPRALGRVGRQPGERLRRRVVGVVPVGEGLDPEGAQPLHLLEARGEDAPERLRLAHDTGAACRRRYPSMKTSMSPSITRSTSPTSMSVRWSFTSVYGWKTYERI